jgi:Na+-translocating ferredoxin:NAD+ oxidoreductase subunit C
MVRSGMYSDAECVVEGSSMAGTAVDPQATVVSPLSEAFTVVRRVQMRPSSRCIRCGWCIDDCPAQIDPALLLHLAETRQFRRAAKAGVERCVECGICSYICPSRLRIMEHLLMMKVQLRRAAAAEA